MEQSGTFRLNGEKKLAARRRRPHVVSLSEPEQRLIDGGEDPSEEELATRSRSGDRAAFELLVR